MFSHDALTGPREHLVVMGAKPIACVSHLSEGQESGSRVPSNAWDKKHKTGFPRAGWGLAPNLLSQDNWQTVSGKLPSWRSCLRSLRSESSAKTLPKSRT